MKATSNFHGDLTSFGPVTTFDRLVFLRLDSRLNMLYIYDLNLNGDTLGDLPVNAKETIRDQQLQGRRPRLSIIKQVIEPLELDPVAIFDIRTMQVARPDSDNTGLQIQE